MILRYVSAKNPYKLSLFFSKLNLRLSIVSGPVWAGDRWVCWFTYDSGKNLGNVDLGD